LIALKSTPQTYFSLTFLIICVNFKGAMTRVFCFSAGIDAFLLIHLHPLVTIEPKCFIVLFSFSSAQLQEGRGTTSRYFGCVPLSIIHRYETQPKRLLLGLQTVQIKSEPETTILNLNKSA